MVKDLTVGKPSSVLWRFSIPMFVSVIFQQMYNIADSVVAVRSSFPSSSGQNGGRR